MLIHSASQIITLQGGPRRGPAMNDEPGIVPDGAILIRDGLIADIGSTEELGAKYRDEEMLDAGDKAIIPGLVDPHTHLVWAGDRVNEFEMRLQGKSYMEIMAAGGGIASTVKQTRESSVEQLVEQAVPRALDMFLHGTTTAEAKSGYGLNLESELQQLEAILKVDEKLPIDLVPTFLGAHAIAPEYAENPMGYTMLLRNAILPAVKDWWLQHAAKRPLPFCDVFCERGAFTLEQSRLILEKARELGFPLKLHVDEFEALGGSELAVELGAASADHLVKTSAHETSLLAHSQTVAVSLPCTPFGLAEGEYSPARAIIDQGGMLAIATDLNPGTAWNTNMQFVMALACRYLKLTPAEALTAATINAAAAIQRDKHIGSLEIGKQADLLILNVNDYRHLMYRFGSNLVGTIIKKGTAYPAFALQRGLNA